MHIFLSRDRLQQALLLSLPREERVLTALHNSQRLLRVLEGGAGGEWAWRLKSMFRHPRVGKSRGVKGM